MPGSPATSARPPRPRRAASSASTSSASSRWRPTKSLNPAPLPGRAASVRLYTPAERPVGMDDLALRGGTVDVGITDGRISSVGAIGPAKVVVDVGGLVVSPGGVCAVNGMRSLAPAALERRLAAGTTTVVVGGRGDSVAPAWAARSPWPTYQAFFDALGSAPLPVNVAALVGHTTLRLEAMGHAARAWWPSERRLMIRWLEEGLEAGCLGLSSGLHAEPGAYAPTAELEEMVGITGRAGGLWCTTAPRSRQGDVEALAGRTGTRTVIHPGGVEVPGRGVLVPGAAADVVVTAPDGAVRHVLVNGVVAVQDGEPTGSRSGAAVRRGT